MAEILVERRGLPDLQADGDHVSCVARCGLALLGITLRPRNLTIGNFSDTIWLPLTPIPAKFMKVMVTAIDFLSFPV